MKTINYVLTLAVLSMMVLACKNEGKQCVKSVNGELSEVSAKLDPNANYAKAEFNIDGMSCAVGCAKKIEKRLSKMEGIKSAKVNFDDRLAMVEYDDARVTPISLEQAIANIGDAYKMRNLKMVDAFAGEKGCDPNCKKKCCASKNKKSTCKRSKCDSDCKKECCAKKGDDKAKACPSDCKKDCCTKKGEAKSKACAPGCKKACCA